MHPTVVTHGGAGASAQHSDGCVAACQAAMAALSRGEGALLAAVAAVRVLEDDPRFNAGYGAVYRLDGKTIQVDAGVADEEGCGAVAGLHNVRHPVDVALAVRRSPHTLMTGAGAQALARKLGIEEEELGTEERRTRAKDAWSRLREDPRWAGVDVEKLWNFEGPMPFKLPPPSGDTVGAVVRDGNGKLAAAGSTGGTGWSLLGRVGDTPLFGAGFYVGPHGAVVATGIGEELTRRLSSRSVHDLMERGMTAQTAAERHVASFPGEWDVGILAVGRHGWGAAANRDMAWAAMEGNTVVGTGKQR
ncbi:MAG: isoaspartyl peptidase/L-asparaginase [Myxococcota bacterium]